MSTSCATLTQQVEWLASVVTRPERDPDHDWLRGHWSRIAIKLSADVYESPMFGIEATDRLIFDVIKRVLRNKLIDLADEYELCPIGRNSLAQAATLGFMKFKQTVRRISDDYGRIVLRQVIAEKALAMPEAADPDWHTDRLRQSEQIGTKSGHFTEHQIEQTT